MTYQGVVGIAVREYLGFYDGTSTWRHKRYVVGVEDEGIVRDYKSGKVYENFICRSEDGVLQTREEYLNIGESYAVEVIIPGLENGKNYSSTQLDKIIQRSNFFTDNYKNMAPLKVKRMIKK